MSAPPPASPRRPEEKRFGPRQIDLPIEKIVALHKAGMSRAVLAKRFGVAPSVITARLKQAAGKPDV